MTQKNNEDFWKHAVSALRKALKLAYLVSTKNLFHSLSLSHALSVSHVCLNFNFIVSLLHCFHLLFLS